MTTKEIKNRVEHIRAIAGDNEGAHIAEDKLRNDFIKYVSELRIPSLARTALAKKAKLVLSTNEIRFARWCS